MYILEVEINIALNSTTIADIETLLDTASITL